MDVGDYTKPASVTRLNADVDFCHNDIDDDSDGDNNESGVTGHRTVTLMPIEFHITSFFELPIVFQKTISNMDNIMKEKKNSIISLRKAMAEKN